MNEITNDTGKCTIALEALKKVLDPEIGLNIVDLGLIYELNFDDGNSRINMAMTLTTQFCPMGESITNSARRVLEDTFKHTKVHLELIFDPPWTPDLISDEGKKFLYM